MAEKILIIGANGFIGSALVERLLEETDYDIYAIDLFDHKIANSLTNERLHFTKADALSNPKWIEDHIILCDVVFPLVAVANPSVYVSDPLFTFQLDFESNLDIVKLCVKHKKHIIFPSTSEVYGMSKDIPFDEDTSSLTLGPIGKQRWIYSCSKQMLDRVIHAYGLKEGLEYTLFRPFNWIGAKQDEIKNADNGSARVLMQFIANIIKGKDINLVDGGMQRRCFTDINDGIDALIKIIQLRKSSAMNQIFNIGNPDSEYTIKDLAKTVIDKISKYPKYSDFAKNTKLIEIPNKDYYGSGYQDVDRRVPSIKKAQELLNWSPTTSLDQSIKDILDYHLL